MHAMNDNTESALYAQVGTAMRVQRLARERARNGQRPLTSIEIADIIRDDAAEDRGARYIARRALLARDGDRLLARRDLTARISKKMKGRASAHRLNTPPSRGFAALDEYIERLERAYAMLATDEL